MLLLGAALSHNKARQGEALIRASNRKPCYHLPPSLCSAKTDAATVLAAI